MLTPPFTVSSTETTSEGEGGEAVFRLKAEAAALTAVVRYRWNATDPVLHKFVEIRNVGDHYLDRLLNVRLGTYRTGPAAASAEPGFPAYVRDEFFLTLAHPAGWATATDSAGENGVSACGNTPASGWRRAADSPQWRRSTAWPRPVVRTRRLWPRCAAAWPRAPSRQALRHLRGLWRQAGWLLRGVRTVRARQHRPGRPGQRDSGCHFDFYSVDFWVDYLTATSKRLERSISPRISEHWRGIGPAGDAPALWIDIRAHLLDSAAIRRCSRR